MDRDGPAQIDLEEEVYAPQAMIPLGSAQKKGANQPPAPSSKPSGDSQADRNKILQEAVEFALMVAEIQKNDFDSLLSQATDPDQRALLQYLSEVNDGVVEMLSGRNANVQIVIEDTDVSGRYRRGDEGSPDKVIVGQRDLDEAVQLVQAEEERGGPGFDGGVRDAVIRHLAATVLHEFAHAVNDHRGSVRPLKPRSAEEAKQMVKDLAEMRAADESSAEIYATLLVQPYPTSKERDYFNNVVKTYLVRTIVKDPGVAPTYRDLHWAYFKLVDDPVSPTRRPYHFDVTELPYRVGYFVVKERFRTHNNCAAEPEACLNSIVDLIDPPSEAEFLRGGQRGGQESVANPPFRKMPAKEDRPSPDQKEREFEAPRGKEAGRTARPVAVSRDKADRAKKKDADEVRRRPGGELPHEEAEGDRPTAQARQPDRQDRDRNRRRPTAQGSKPSASRDRPFWRPAARPGQGGQPSSESPAAERPQGGAPSSENRPGGGSPDSGTPVVPGPGGGGVPAPQTNQPDPGGSKIIYRHIWSRNNDDGSTTHHGYLERDDGTMEEVDITCRGASCSDQNGRTYQPQHEDGTPMTDEECNGNCGFQDGTAFVPASNNPTGGNPPSGNGGNPPNGGSGNEAAPDDCNVDNNCPDGSGGGGKVNPNSVPSIISVGGVVMIRGVGVSQDRIDPLCFRAKCPQRNGAGGQASDQPGAGSGAIPNDPCDDPAAHCSQDGQRGGEAGPPAQQDPGRDPTCQKDGCPGYGPGPRDGNIPVDSPPGSGVNLGAEGGGSGADPKVSRGQSGGKDAGSRRERTERKQESPAVKPTGR